MHRRTVVAATTEEAVKLLAKPEPSRVSTGQAAASAPGVVFMFSGQGSQYVNMGRELYETEAVFRAQLDHCAERLIPDLGLDLRTLLYPPEEDSAAAAQKLSHTALYAARVVQHRICAGAMVDGARNRAFRHDRPQYRRVRGCLPGGCVLA